MLAGCTSVSAPVEGGRDLVYVIGRRHSIAVVNPRPGSIVAHVGSLPEILVAPVLSPDSSTLYFNAFTGGRSSIFALDAHSFVVRPWLRLLQESEVSNDSLWVVGNQLAFAPEGGELFADAVVMDTSNHSPFRVSRLAVIDTVTGSVRTSFGPLSVGSLISLPAGPVAPYGALIGMVRPPSFATGLTMLEVVDPMSGTIVDSSVVPQFGDFDFPASLVSSPDGRRVYILGFKSVHVYDLLTHQLLGAATETSFDTHLAVSPNGAKVYLFANPLPTSGARAPPTSVRVFDADLVEAPSLTFTRQFGVEVPALHDIGVSSDNSLLYLEATNRRDGMDVLLVMNIATGMVVRSIQLGPFGGEKLLVGH